MAHLEKIQKYKRQPSAKSAYTLAAAAGIPSLLASGALILGVPDAVVIGTMSAAAGAGLIRQVFNRASAGAMDIAAILVTGAAGVAATVLALNPDANPLSPALAGSLAACLGARIALGSSERKSALKLSASLVGGWCLGAAMAYGAALYVPAMDTEMQSTPTSHSGNGQKIYALTVPDRSAPQF